MLCQCLLYNDVNLLYVYTYRPPLGPVFPPPISPLQVITEHRVERPVLYSRFPLASYFTHGGLYVSILISQFVSPSSSALHDHVSVLYVCISIPAPKIDSFVPFSQISHICVNMQYLVSSFSLTSLCVTNSRSINISTNYLISFLL